MENLDSCVENVVSEAERDMWEQAVEGFYFSDTERGESEEAGVPT